MALVGVAGVAGIEGSLAVLLPPPPQATNEVQTTEAKTCLIFIWIFPKNDADRRTPSDQTV